MLFTLLSQARKLSNAELEALIGVRLDGKERRRLNDLKLVESEMHSGVAFWGRNAPEHGDRYTYAGQKDGFPLPAIFQSGMEHNNWTYGVGF